MTFLFFPLKWAWLRFLYDAACAVRRGKFFFLLFFHLIMWEKKEEKGRNEDNHFWWGERGKKKEKQKATSNFILAIWLHTISRLFPPFASKWKLDLFGYPGGNFLVKFFFGSFEFSISKSSFLSWKNNF